MPSMRELRTVQAYEEHSTNESIFVQAFLIANSPAKTDDETFNTS